MHVAVINCSTKYNLGLAKAANYYRRWGHRVVESRYIDLTTYRADLFLLSALFTWDLPGLIDVARHALALGGEVRIGGPAATLMAGQVEAATGLRVHRGLNPEWDTEPGEYRVTFTSRGCPNRCAWCAAHRLEELAEYDDWPVAGIIQDNNVLATSWAHQERLVERLLSAGCRPVDFNSGFDARLFTDRHYELYSQLPLKCWRLAFDWPGAGRPASEMIGLLRERGVRRRASIMVYALYGFGGDSLAAARDRVEKIIAWGASPWPMPYVPLDWTGPGRYVAPGWSRATWVGFYRYYSRAPLWGSPDVSWETYCRGRQSGP